MRVHVQNLGCRLNLAESERLAQALRLEGHTWSEDPAQADLRVVNTCTVTAEAGRESRVAARPLRPGQRVIATGCHADRHPEDFPLADTVVPNAEKDGLGALLRERFGREGLALGMAAAPDRHAAVYPLALDTTRAFVKIQDGCDLRCSFCLTALARGPARSREAEDIVAEIRHLVAGGCQEVVLTGVHAGAYGLDLHRDLGWLVDRLLVETDLPRLRLSSLEPWNFRAEWTALWSAHAGRLCRHLHMSLQSGSRTVLRRMRRRYDPETFAEKVDAARQVPGLAVTTDLIAGFPGETEDEHAESLAFVRALAFAGAHVFRYSARPGTEAARLPGQLSGDLRRRRAAELTAVVRESERAFRRNLHGVEAEVLWEKPAPSGQVTGHTDTYAEVVWAGSGLPARNSRQRCRLIFAEGELRALPLPA
jgi:threonylcarbamoyladenosine tRNA methylthiotransferase MtaB